MMPAVTGRDGTHKPPAWSTWVWATPRKQFASTEQKSKVQALSPSPTLWECGVLRQQFTIEKRSKEERWPPKQCSRLGDARKKLDEQPQKLGCSTDGHSAADNDRDVQDICKTTAELLTLRERRKITQCLHVGDRSLSNPVSRAFLHLPVFNLKHIRYFYKENTLQTVR